MMYAPAPALTGCLEPAQPQLERGATACAVDQLGRAAVGPGTDRASGSPSPVPLRGAVSAVRGDPALEDALAVGGGHARAVVGDLQHGDAVARERPQGDALARGRSP